MTDHGAARRGSCIWALGTAVVTAGFYLVFLGWHAKMTSSNGSACSGPYDGWQDVALAVALTAVVAVVAWNGHPWSASVSCAVCLTVLWSADAATVVDPCRAGANFWPLGAAILLAGSAAGLGSVAALASSGGSALRRRGVSGRSTIRWLHRL